MLKSSVLSYKAKTTNPLRGKWGEKVGQKRKRAFRQSRCLFLSTEKNILLQDLSFQEPSPHNQEGNETWV